ncbi:MAG: hypothetical protein ACT4O3_08030, partial [Elusimicrobiota bacterium]
TPFALSLSKGGQRFPTTPFMLRQAQHERRIFMRWFVKTGPSAVPCSGPRGTRPRAFFSRLSHEKMPQ